MYRHRLAIVAVAVVLPFSVAACSSGGAIKVGGQGVDAQQNVQPISPSGSSKPSDAISTPDSDTATSKGDEANPAGSSSFCQAFVKAQDDSDKLADGDSTASAETLKHELQALAPMAPADIKGDLQALVSAKLAELAKGNTGDAGNAGHPELVAPGARVASWAAAHCSQ